MRYALGGHGRLWRPERAMFGCFGEAAEMGAVGCLGRVGQQLVDLAGNVAF